MHAYSAKLTHAIDIVEAAYDLRGTSDDWLRRLVRAIAADLDGGRGTYGFVATFAETGLDFDSQVAHVGVDPALVAKAAKINAHLPPAVLESLRSRMVELASASAAFGPSSDVVRRIPRVARGARDSVTAFAQDGESRIVQVIATTPDPVVVHPRAAAAWRRVLFHVGAGLRLRDRIVRKDERPLALLSPDSRIAHAEGDARPRSSRDALMSAVKDMERARGPRTRGATEEALALWRGLVLGRWSLVDHFESDGRRYLAAHENVPDIADPRALSPWERACLRYFVRGASTDEIAFALGYNVATVGRSLSSIARRLGFPNRATMRRLAGSLDRISVNRRGESLDVLVLPRAEIHERWLAVLGRAEQAVARLALDGRSDAEIAAARGTSVRTASNQLRALYRKTGASGRADLARRLERSPPRDPS